jgi:hypothetical protein
MFADKNTNWQQCFRSAANRSFVACSVIKTLTTVIFEKWPQKAVLKIWRKWNVLEFCLLSWDREISIKTLDRDNSHFTSV